MKCSQTTFIHPSGMHGLRLAGSAGLVLGFPGLLVSVDLMDLIGVSDALCRTHLKNLSNQGLAYQVVTTLTLRRMTQRLFNEIDIQFPHSR